MRTTAEEDPDDRHTDPYPADTSGPGECPATADRDDARRPVRRSTPRRRAAVKTAGRSGRTAVLMDLTRHQRDQIQRLLEDELRQAWRTAGARGTTPADVAELLDDRRHAMDFLLLDEAEDVQYAGDDVRNTGGVGEQG
jgi:hypothetical protein